MSIRERLEQWHQIRQIEPIEEAPSVAGGREAEILLKELAETHFRFKDAFLLAGRRIPSKRTGRKREVDLIVCTPQRIHILEVKNWSGQLSTEDGTWRQLRRGGGVLEHENPVEKNLLKRDVIVEYLRTKGVKLDKAFVQQHMISKVVFMNRRLQLSPAIEQHPDVISRGKLEEYLGRQKRKTFSERLFSSLIELCLDSDQQRVEKVSQTVTGRIPTALYERIVSCLAQTGTWDHLHLFGTKIIAGDLVSVRLGKQVHRREQLVRMAAGKPLRLKWARSRVIGLWKTITGAGNLGTLHLGAETLPVSPDDVVEFHEVGSGRPGERSLAEVDEIVLG